MNKLHRRIASNHVKVVKRLALQIKPLDKEYRALIREARTADYQPGQLRHQLLQGRKSKLRKLGRAAIDNERKLIGVNVPFNLSADFSFRVLAYKVLLDKKIPSHYIEV